MSRRVWQTLYGALAACLLLWGAFFIFQSNNLFLTSACFFIVFFILGAFSWTVFTDLLILIMPLFVAAPSLFLGIPTNYSLAELALLGGMAALLLRGALHPRIVRSSCPMTYVLLFFALTALCSTSGVLFFCFDVHGSFFLEFLLSGIVNSIGLHQEEPQHTFSATMAIIEAGVVFHLVLARIQLPGGRERLLRMMALAGGLVGAVGVVQYATGWGLSSYWEEFEDMRRINSTWADPNACGSYLLMALAATVAWSATRRKNKPFGLLEAVVAGLILWALYLTRSDITRVGLVAGLLWFGVMRYYHVAPLAKGIYRRRWLFAVLAGLLLVGTYCSLALFFRHNSGLVQWMGDDHQLAVLLRGRLNIWQRCLALTAETPWFGIGSGQLYSHLSWTWMPTEVLGWNLDVLNWNPTSENAHNQFLQYLAELGLFGGVLFICLVALALFRALPTTEPNDSRDHRIHCVLGAGLVAFLVTFFTGHPLVWKELFALFAALVALLYYPGSEAGEAPGARRSGRLTIWALALLVCCSASPLAAGIVAWRQNRSGEREPWQESYGIFKAEELLPEEYVYTWTQQRAGKVIVAEKPVLTLNLRALNPDLPERPLEVKLFFNDALLDVFELTDDAWRQCSYALPVKAGERFWLRIHTSRDWSPKEWGEEDARQLGIQLGEQLEWRDALPDEGLGFYHWEQDNSGRRVRWMKAFGAIKASAASKILYLRAINPSLSHRPQRIKIYHNDFLIQEIYLGPQQLGEWLPVSLENASRLPGTGHFTNQPLLFFSAEYLWRPSEEFGSEDDRRLSIQVSDFEGY